MKTHYSNNILRVYWLSICTGLTFASALVVPFFTGQGLNQTQIMLLQTVFSLSAVLLEVPTGYVADRFGRSVSLRAGALAIAVGFMGYALSGSFELFLLFEVVLALGVALISGADEALMYDSLLADKKQHDYQHVAGRLQTYLFASTALGAPIGSLVASRIGVAPVLFADGLLAVAGFAIAMSLVEPPTRKKDEVGRHPIRDMAAVVKYCLRDHEVLPSLMLFSAALSASTYFGFWLAPTYYKEAGVSLAFFGLIAAARSLVKVFLSHRQKQISKRLSSSKQLLLYANISVASYILLAIFVSPWAVLFFFGFDMVQALQGPVVSAKVHALTDSNVRAQTLSVMSLMRRGFYALSGPVVGFVVDKSLRLGMLFCAMLFWLFLISTLIKLKTKKAL